MARWKLMSPHYLRVEDCEWEYQEIDRKTNRQVRRKFQVPMLLDPRDPSYWTNKWGREDDAEGEIIVCFAGKGESRDIVFFGDPTPDMMPIDDEAKAISASFTERWSYKPETDEGSYSQSLVDKFQMEMAMKESVQPPIKIDGLDQMMAQMAASQAMMAEAMKLMATNTVRRP